LNNIESKRTGPNSGNLILSIIRQIEWLGDRDSFTVGDLAKQFGHHNNGARKVMAHFERAGLVRHEKRNGRNNPVIWHACKRVVPRVDFDDRCKHEIPRETCFFCRTKRKEP
jgi:hypothetical protein